MAIPILLAVDWNAQLAENVAIRLAAFCIAVGVIWRYLVLPIWRKLHSAFVRVEAKLDRIETAADWVNEKATKLETDVAWVVTELSPNHGSSLRDRVDAAVAQGEANQAGISDVATRLDALEGVRSRRTPN